jgi:hypothetical protein
MLKINYRSESMRKLILLPLMLLLVACGSATTPEVTTAPEDTGGEAAVEDNTTGDAGSEEIASADGAPQDGKSSVATGATPQEASIVREQDYTKGADDPTVTIIEYGDFQ